jgi:hypothetical protein
MVLPMVGASLLYPPEGSWFPRTPWLCAYCPVSIVDRDGQQSE